MSCSGNLIWDVRKRAIGYTHPNTIRTNFLGKSIKLFLKSTKAVFISAFFFRMTRLFLSDVNSVVTSPKCELSENLGYCLC